MIVYKFGGASIADPERMTALLPIILQADLPLVIVVSAYGKTTNALEKIVDYAFDGEKEEAVRQLQLIENLHNDFAEKIASGENLKGLKNQLQEHYTEILWAIDDAGLKPKDYLYDQVVSVGEMLSSTIFSSCLKQNNIEHGWVDVRNVFRTDDCYRSANIDEAFTQMKIQDIIIPLLKEKKIIITQGFIGCTSDNASTTLGREGSDYSAALFGAFLPARSVSIWKDVEGFLNADPKQFSPTQKIDKISYHEVIEMTYYGAQIIHPKTIKPLQNAKIPLYVKCFLDPKLNGTLVYETDEKIEYPPLMVLKGNQVLLQITSRDYSFMNEDNVSNIYQTFYDLKIKINLIQHAAISLVICVDKDELKLQQVIEVLEDRYRILRNEALSLLTIRHYNERLIKDMLKGKEIILEQKTRSTVQLLF